MGLADFARPGAMHPIGRKIAAGDEAQRVEQFSLEVVGPAAIIGETRKRADRREIAGDGAEVVSSPQMATITPPGTPYCSLIRASVAP